MTRLLVSARPHPEETFSSVPGVTSTSVGYTGGDSSKPSYGSVCSGDGHTEAIKINFDPSKVSYNELVDMFMTQHDPHSKMPTQYQSAVWPQNKAQEESVFNAIEKIEARGRTVFTKVRWYRCTPGRPWADRMTALGPSACS
jgi:peptide-methionine (S)-S-oxide reductase